MTQYFQYTNPLTLEVHIQARDVFGKVHEASGYEGREAFNVVKQAVTKANKSTLLNQNSIVH